VVVVATACHSDDVIALGTEIRTITVDSASVTALVGTTVPLTAQIIYRGKSETRASLTWASADSTLFRIDTVTAAATTGTHRAIGRALRPGRTTFIVRGAGNTYTVPVTVSVQAVVDR
jgi:hypothetical protein